MQFSFFFNHFHRVVQESSSSNSRTFSSLQKEAPCPLEVTSHSSLILYAQPLAAINLLSVSMDLPVLDISYKWNHKTWPSVTGFFHLAQRFQGSAMSQSVTAFHSFYC